MLLKRLVILSILSVSFLVAHASAINDDTAVSDTIRFDDGVPGEPRRIAEDLFVSGATLELDADGVPVFVSGDCRLRADGSGDNFL